MELKMKLIIMKRIVMMMDMKVTLMILRTKPYRLVEDTLGRSLLPEKAYRRRSTPSGKKRNKPLKISGIWQKM